MKRFHVHVAVKELQDSIRFYTAMFGTSPTVVKPDYAKWMLEDPRINFAISQRSQKIGINHLGLQAESEEEFEGIHANLQQADATIVAEKGAHCCYARSDKYWITDPQGIAWESFRSLGSIPLYREEGHTAAGASGTGEGICCAPISESPGSSFIQR
ncbi:MAG TPA: ArsI/CadI family heavy metal resistance metalloenzyme [Casimicrobiaceae bacterium]|jgi:catechol 2,3-dioxygenase-like lactoylglutathione lyase family enzyme